LEVGLGRLLATIIVGTTIELETAMHAVQLEGGSRTEVRGMGFRSRDRQV